VHIHERQAKIARAERSLLAKHGREPTELEIAEESKLPLAQVRGVRTAARAAASLDEPVGSEDSDSRLADLLADNAAVDPLEAVSEGLKHHAISQALDRLTDRQRFILRRRYGLDGGDPATLDEIAGALGLTRERVRQLEVETLQLLRSREEVQGLRESFV